MFSKPADMGLLARQFDAMAKAAPGPSETPRILKNLEEALWKWLVWPRSVSGVRSLSGSTVRP
jgi:hypothetical protein